MTPTTNTLLISALFLCGLDNPVLSQHGHCAGNQCFALFQEPVDFPGARERCKDSGGQLVSSSEGEVIWRRMLKGVSGRFWLDVLGATRERDLQKCPTISTQLRWNLTVLFEPCREKLEGFLCQFNFQTPCSSLQAGGGTQVNYTAMGFEVRDSDTFPPGTVAVAEKVGAKYPDSKHICFSKNWRQAPWSCEVMQGGCEYKCNGETRACACAAGHTIQPNKITCAPDPCAKCSQECQREGDTHVCKCRKGYRLAKDGTTCADVDECEEENSCTGENWECENTEGHFQCRCKDGFGEDNGVCVDMSICEKCEHMMCNPFNGVYMCECRKGFKVSNKDPAKCEMDCTERDCEANCIPNTDNKNLGMLQCFCPDGYILDQTNDTAICSDINECENEKQCDHTCENLLGSFICLCDKGYEPHKNGKCKPIKEDEIEDGSGTASPYPTPAGAHPGPVPSYIQTGSILGITVFMALCAALLFFMVHNALKRCGKFELSPLKHSNIDIFYLHQVTTDTYKRLSFDK